METRERILQGSRELFMLYGIRRVTMDDVARHLGMSKKTIYSVYKDKDELVQSLLEDELNENERCFLDINNKADNAVAECFELMKFMTGMFKKVNPWMFYDLQKYHPQSFQYFQNFKEEHMKGQIVANLERGIKEGLYRPNLNVEVLAILRQSQIEMGMSPMLFPPDKFELAKVQVELLDHFLHGILTLKGHKLINKYQQVQEEEG
jgi:TetR/AcrR family transcriptional regulator, cholesterol catabolism regulator